MKVKAYQLKSLRGWELVQMVSDALVFIENQSEGMPEAYMSKMEELRTAFQICNDEVFLQRRISTSDVFEAEALRDYDIRKLHSIISDYSDYRYDKQKEEAAQALMFIFKRYGTGYTISRMPQDTQWSLMDRLLQELDRESSQQHLATLHLTEVMEALIKNNNSFKKAQQIRLKKEAHYVTGVVKAARKDLTKEFLEFVDIVNALAMLEGQEKYAELKLIMNALIKETVGSGKQKKRKVEEEEDVKEN